MRSFSKVAKSDASFLDQSTPHGCLACQAFLGSHQPDLLHDQAGPGPAEGAQILDAAVAVAVATAAAAEPVTG